MCEENRINLKRICHSPYIAVQDRLREITIRDLRKISEPVKNLPLDMSAG